MALRDFYDRRQYIERALAETDTFPILGNAPPFPWDTFLEHVKELSGIPDLEIRPEPVLRYLAEDAGQEIGLHPVPFHFSVLPLQGHVTLFMSSEDAATFISWTMGRKTDPDLLLASQFLKGFMDFTALEILHRIQPYPMFDGFLLRLLREASLPPTSGVLLLDVVLSSHGEKIVCRLIIPELFRKHWIEKFVGRPPFLSEEDKKKLEVICSLRAGQFLLYPEDWAETAPGDFIPLRTEHAYIAVGEQPLYRVRIKDKEVKILEQPVYEEVLMEENEKLSVGTEEEGDTPEREIPESSSIDRIPIRVSVELARFKMTYERLLHLKPGQLLEPGISQDRPVDLIVNDRKIATAELVRIGETVGIRILDRF